MRVTDEDNNRRGFRRWSNNPGASIMYLDKVRAIDRSSPVLSIKTTGASSGRLVSELCCVRSDRVALIEGRPSRNMSLHPRKSFRCLAMVLEMLH